MLGSNPLDHCAIATAAEAAGFDGVALSDHVVHPETLSSAYPYTSDGRPMYTEDELWPDPWVSVGAMAAVTKTLEFMTNVYVLPSRNPFVAAKAVGTAAFLSAGRVRLGVGAGWMREEFDVMGQKFAGRGGRMDEMIDILRLLWSGEVVEHHGKHYSFDRLSMQPAPAAPVPIYIGGHSDIALNRAATKGDGWIGVNYAMDQLRGYCDDLRRRREEAGTADQPFDLVASPLAMPDARTIEDLASMGVTTVLTSAWMAAGKLRVEREQAVDLVGSYGEKFIAALRP